MRLLVLGGTGWLGRTVAETALTAGHEVTCLARGRSGAPPAGCLHIEADRDEPDAYAGVAGEWDGVIDVSRTPQHVTGALAALADRTTRWVFVSTGNVYRSHAELDQDETAPLLDPLGNPEGEPTPESYGGAKVACEQAVLAACVERAVIARAGLIGGPGDESGRSGYWPWRFAHPSYADGSVLVPAADLPASLIDVRDLAEWLVAAAAGEHRTGTFDAVANRMPLAEFLAVAREVAGHTRSVVQAPDAWLVAQGVQEWSGPASLPLWLADPEWRGFAAHRGAAIRDNGFIARPLEETLRDVLAWEDARPQPGPHGAGLTDAEERRLLRRYGGQMARTVQITFDCEDPERVAAFWAAALDYRVPPGVPEVAEDPDGVGPRIYCQRVPEGKVVKNRVHLDLRVGTGLTGQERVDALEVEGERLAALGASRLWLLPADEENEACLVMQDVEGNEFCLD